MLINPLHAAEPLPPVSASPYLPMTRRYVSPLYLRIEDIAEYRQLDAGQRARIEALAAPLRARNATPALIDRDAVWAAKRAALEIIHRVPLSEARRGEYERFRKREGRDLEDWAAWCALAERHGPDWRDWPGPRPRSAPHGREPPGRGAEFHAWLQWLTDEQQAAAQRAALAAGMDTGIIGDLAVGAHPGGADAWAHQDLLVSGLSVGAPPDEFNQRGQDWSQPPWHPRRLAADRLPPAERPVRRRAAARRRAAGRPCDGPDAAVVHARGLAARPWRLHPLRPPVHGGGAGRPGGPGRGLAIGEDLGTVDRWIREYLTASRIIGHGDALVRPRAQRDAAGPAALAARLHGDGGHPRRAPAAAFRTGDQVTVRARLGVLTQPEEAERDSARQMLSQWRNALVGRG